MFDVSTLRSGAKTTETVSLGGVPHDPRMLAAADEIERLRDGLEAIRQYGSDTARERAKATAGDWKWQRAGVVEMANRAWRVLNGQPWLDPETNTSKEGKSDGCIARNSRPRGHSQRKDILGGCAF